MVQPPVGKKPPVAPKTDLSHAQAQAREIILEAKDEALKIRTALEQKELELKDLKASQLDKLKAISRLKPDEAKKMLLSAYEKRLTRDIAEIVSEAEERAKAEADEKAKEILVEAMRHGATDYVAEYTVSIVKLPSEDSKGRIIRTNAKCRFGHHCYRQYF